MTLSCRFYENEFPVENEVVVAVVKSITNSGSYVNLPEYNNALGMILHSELSRRRIRSINKLVRVGRSDIVIVIRVDPDKGYIDLSKRQVPFDEIKVCYDRFAKAKAVNQIVRHVAEKLGYTENSQFEDLCAKTVWYFDRKYAGQGGSHEAFKRAVQDPTILDECDIDDATKEMLLQDIRHRLMPVTAKIRADFEVSCFTYEGIDAVRRALRTGLDFSDEKFTFNINLIAPPEYVMTTQTLDVAEGIARMEEAIEAIEKSINEQEGFFKLKVKPRVVSDKDEIDLQNTMEDLLESNREVSADETESEEEEEDEEEGEEGSEDESASVANGEQQEEEEEVVKDKPPKSSKNKYKSKGKGGKRN
ncbi:unnamed protein product [Hymenolepis diminuta]|uniref:Eukaryotic translation initiation factor 2 subunit 1 n=2 Tax=Hymenolepis diminuta TaxID=6216 RepID=A0A564Y7V8_HYMDI|nr:unnamed protein product [Hymenolepis diminuta]